MSLLALCRDLPASGDDDDNAEDDDDNDHASGDSDTDSDADTVGGQRQSFSIRSW